MIINQHKQNPEERDTRSDQAIRVSELKFRRLFETARDGVLILEADTGRISDVNPFLMEVLGLSHAELVGVPIWELGPFKDTIFNKSKFELLQEKGYVRYEHLPLEAKDGRKVDVEFISNVYQVGAQQTIQCNIRDITKRKTAERERSRLAAIIEHSGDAIISKTVDGIVIGWNHGAEKQYGYTTEEMLGHSIAVLFPPSHYEEYLEIMKKVRLGEVVADFDTVRQRKDGSLINVSVGITPIETRDGTVFGASKVSHDISRIKKLELQLIQAQKMEVVGQFAAGIAHDFNNILAVIMGYSHLLVSKLAADSPLRKCTSEIGHAAERAGGLTRQLLIFCRKQTVQPVVIDLNATVKELEQMLRRLVGENIGLTIVTEKEIGCIKADAGYIGQVLMNLVVNARDAMSDGGKLVIEIRNIIVDENKGEKPKCAIPGDYVMLSVSDTGTGMTDDVKKHLFEAFFTTKPKGKGTGLGLATCQTIIEQSSGFIDVQSEVGKGTTFKIYFPRVGLLPENPVRPAISEPEPRGTETVLIVEDDPSVRLLARNVLETQGYDVLSAANGQEALQIAHSHKGSPIQLVITDVIMPLMGGKVMADWLKTTYPDLKILFTSGYTDEAIIQQGVLEAGVEFLAKPYSPATLARKIRKMLDSRLPKKT